MAFCRLLIVLVFAMLWSSCGCGGDPVKAKFAEANPDNIHRLCRCYTNFQFRHKEEGPKDEAEFRAYLQSDQAAKFMGLIGVNPANLDATFTNERDKNPFKIRFGVEGSRAGSDLPIIFEELGDGSTRQVGFTSGKVRNATDEQYEAWWKGEFEAGNEPTISTRDEPDQNR